MAPAFADRLERRGGETALEGQITRIDDGGVTIRSASGAEQTITWDRVREVKMEYSVPTLAEYRDVAATLWRARSRLERGDTMLAEPLFERLFSEYCANQQHKRTHETALIIAEGLLRCRLARGANDTAVIPALELARLRRKGLKTNAYSMLPALFDEATALFPQLPPAWAPTAALARLEVELKTFDAGGDPIVAAMAALYRAASREQAGLDWDLPPKMAEDQKGVSFLRLLLGAQVRSADDRAAARLALEKQMPDLPVWAQAWTRYALGTSLLREEGAARQESGLVSLSYLPATFLRQQPHLAALAMATMSRTLQGMGLSDGAVAMRNELMRMFPGHPAAATLDRPLPSTSQPATQPAAGRSAAASSSAGVVVTALHGRWIHSFLQDCS